MIKTKLLTIAFAFLLVPSCQIFQGTANPDKMVTITQTFKQGTAVGVRQLIVKNPKVVPYLHAVTQAIEFSINNGQLEPAQVIANIEKFVKIDAYVKEILTVGLALAIDNYKQFYAANVSQVVPEKMRVVLHAIAEGIEFGVQLSGKEPLVVNPLTNISSGDLKL